MLRARGFLDKLAGAFRSRGASSRLATEEMAPLEVPPGGYDCVQVRQLASRYIEEDANTGVLAAIRKHLEACENCAAFISTLRKTVGLLRDMPKARAPGNLRDNIKDATSGRRS